MKDLFDKLSLYTDFYEFTMAQGYFRYNQHERPAGFDYFFRKTPFNGGYVVFAGLENLLDILENFHYDDEAIEFLRAKGFKDDFLDYLKNFHFNGNIFSVREGEIVFPNTPIMRVEGGWLETQLIETVLLNTLNFQSLIATKATRIRRVVGERLLIDFGLRRAQGLSGLHASRAALIGGADATSNVLAGYYYKQPVSGTQAHSWIQGFDNELEAFRKYAQMYPEHCVLLVDTYDVLKSGIPNAILVANEMKARAHHLKGIRLDSGDLSYLSKKARAMLNAAGLQEVKIVASNELDEYLIRSLNEQQAPIDAFGVGTKLITAYDCPALDGVYKLSMINHEPALKISSDVSKINLPGTKKVYRYLDSENQFLIDGILLHDEENSSVIHHPIYPGKQTSTQGLNYEEILQPVIKQGKRLSPRKEVNEIAAYCKERLKRLPSEHQRFENPHIYKVGISQALLKLRANSISNLQKGFYESPARR